MAFGRDAKKLGPEALYEYALGALGRRSLTESELRRKLYLRAAEPAHIDEALTRIRSLGYLDDAQVAESHTNFRKEYDALGSRRVFSELRRRGVDPETARNAVATAYDEVDESEQIRRYLERKLARRLEKPIDDPKEIARLTRTLIRAGFSSGKIVEALQKVAADPGWLDGVEDPEPIDPESP
jgi:regulatory protein